MPEPVTDHSLTVIRLTPERHAALPPAAQEMLRTYPSRSWTEDGVLAYEVATHRVNEIIAACGGLCTLASTSSLTSAEIAVSSMLAHGRRGL